MWFGRRGYLILCVKRIPVSLPRLIVIRRLAQGSEILLLSSVLDVFDVVYKVVVRVAYR